jgi:NhaP-type Na+/H+ or K+/H+ antiporter
MIEFWEFVIFLVNSIVFLLLGDQVLFPYFLEHIDTSLVAIAAVLASRAVAIFGFSAISGLITRNPIPWAEQTVLWWVGLRGFGGDRPGPESARPDWRSPADYLQFLWGGAVYPTGAGADH